MNLNFESKRLENSIELSEEIHQRVGKVFNFIKVANRKGNWGNIKFEDHEMRDEYKMWVDECSNVTLCCICTHSRYVEGWIFLQLMFFMERMEKTTY